MKSDALLTAIIFTYNHKMTIRRCIDSIIQQKTDYNYIIHIWDDCSFDGTSEICHEYAVKYPDKIDLFVQKENTFLKSYYELQSYSAIQRLDTKYFCIIDGDDYWLDEHKLQIALDFLEANPEYIGFAHDTLEVNKYSNTSLSYIHELYKYDVTNPITFKADSPFFLSSSRIFRNCGFKNAKLLPIDYLLYYYHLSQGPIYYYDKIMAAYIIGDSSSFAGSGTAVIDLNSMFSYRLALMFDFKQDTFCTDMQKIIDTRNGVGARRYKRLIWFKKLFGIKLGWQLWFLFTFVPKFGLKSMNIHYVYSRKEAKKRVDENSKNNSSHQDRSVMLQTDLGKKVVGC